MTANITYRLGTAGTPPVSTAFKNAPLDNTEIDGNFKSILNDLDIKAPIVSPTFTGIPAAPTAATGTNTTQLATTQFVLTNSVLKTGTAATAGAFDTGTTTPTGTTRLNYGGSFYPTTINLIGTADTVSAATHYFVETGTDGIVRPKTLANVKAEVVTTAAVNSAAATTVGNISTGTWQASTIGAGYGGTGNTSYAVGDILFASSTSGLSKLTAAATGNVLISGGLNAAPSYGKVGLGVHTTGTLPVANGGTGQTSLQTTINSLAGATTSGSYLRGNGTNIVMSAIQTSDVPTLNQNTTGTATNAVNLDGTGTAKTSAAASSGYGLWGSTPITYGMLMSSSTDTTYGGRFAGETTSDYNMYFTMGGGTNRGFVFRSAHGSNLFSINPNGVRTSLAVTGTSFNSITGLGSTAAALAASTTAGSATTVSRSDHTHAFPTAANIGLGNVTNESKTTMFSSPTFTGTVSGVSATHVGLGSVTNESKATMFSSPTFTGTTTVANLIVNGTTTTLNSTTLDVADLNITVAKNATTAAAANGAGLTIGNYASNPTLLYGSASNNFTFNRAVLATSFNSITALSSTNPVMDGSVTIGTSTTVARSDHRHPTDTSRSASTHVHGNITNTGYLGTTASIPLITGTSGIIQAGAFGTAAGSFCQGNDARLSNARAASDVYAWAKAASKPSYTKAEVGLGSVDNTADSAKSVNYASSAGTANALNPNNSYSVVGLTVGNGQVGSTITMFDSDEGNRLIYCNSNQIGFLTQAGAWGAWLDDSNNWTAAGNITAYSDIRIKTNIEKITGALDKVDQLNGYTFDRTDINTTRQTGVIAQEVLKVLPEAVLGTEETTYGVAYGNMVGLLIEAIKELRAEVTDLKARLK